MQKSSSFLFPPSPSGKRPNQKPMSATTLETAVPQIFHEFNIERDCQAFQDALQDAFPHSVLYPFSTLLPREERAGHLSSRARPRTVPFVRWLSRRRFVTPLHVMVTAKLSKSVSYSAYNDANTYGKEDEPFCKPK